MDHRYRAIFGILLWVVDARAKQVKTMDEMTWKDALIFGIGRMLALIPGVSRSGGTITFGRAMGYTREAAVRVSFLMAIPAVFGAGILEAVSAVKDVAAGNAGMFPGWGATIAATIVAFVVGYVVIIGTGCVHLLRTRRSPSTASRWPLSWLCC